MTSLMGRVSPIARHGPAVSARTKQTGTGISGHNIIFLDILSIGRNKKKLNTFLFVKNRSWVRNNFVDVKHR